MRDAIWQAECAVQQDFWRLTKVLSRTCQVEAMSSISSMASFMPFQMKYHVSEYMHVAKYKHVPIIIPVPRFTPLV